MEKSQIIYIVDDDPDDREFISEALQRAGSRAKLVYASNGKELLHQLALFKAEAPPLVLLDLNMPQMNGLEALAHIRHSETLSTTPVIVLSTSHAEKDVASAYREGANTYLCKPTQFAKLVQMLKVVHEYWLEQARWPPFASA